MRDKNAGNALLSFIVVNVGPNCLLLSRNIGVVRWSALIPSPQNWPGRGLEVPQRDVKLRIKTRPGNDRSSCPSPSWRGEERGEMIIISNCNTFSAGPGHHPTQETDWTGHSTPWVRGGGGEVNNNNN